MPRRMGGSKNHVDQQDLLRPASENMQIREGENGVFVAGVHEQEIKSVDECLRHLQLGDRNRSVQAAQHRMPC